ncbi:MAG: VOC family protein [Luteolibacter sp.]
MNKLIFINLPVADLPRSKEFFSALGYTFNAQFTNDDGACMVVSDTIHVMLLTHPHFSKFAPNPISDAKTSTGVLICLSCDSREEVDTLVAKAVAAGATTYNPPRDYGSMYGHEFQDHDGHVWEFMWVDPAFIQKD